MRKAPVFARKALVFFRKAPLFFHEVRPCQDSPVLLTRNFARKELKTKGAYEDLMNARLRLHDHWMDATSHRTTADAKLAARFSGVTSANVMLPQKAPDRLLVPEKIISNVEVASTQRFEIPSFESFEML